MGNGSTPIPIVVTAILCIAVLEFMALWRGIDGTYFGLVVAAIAGLGGFTLRHYLGR